MAELIISTPANFGPLSVEVITAKGEPVAERPILLSSAQQITTLHDLDPGSYAVIGTRPNGETLVKRVTLEAGTGYANFESSRMTPDDLTSGALARGLVPAVLSQARGEATSERLNTLNTRHFPNSAGRTLQSLLLPKVRAESGRATGNEAVRSEGINFGKPIADERTAKLAIRHWEFDGDKWREIYNHVPFEFTSDYVQISVEAGPPDRPRAFGLTNDDGFGPIVLAPHFRLGMQITFLADGLAAGYAAERISNPSSVRVPVAAAVPQDAGLADLLSALAAASMPDAQSLWRQDALRRLGGREDALDKLLNKFADPSAALLGAHFLARFEPNAAPVGWLENLSGLLPHIADPLVLLALRLIAEDSTEVRTTSRLDIASILTEARRRPCFLFSRTRATLMQALRLYGPTPPAKMSSSAGKARSRLSDFLDFAADAGRLEAFWGSSPARPGQAAKTPKARVSKMVIHLQAGSFVQ